MPGGVRCVPITESGDSGLGRGSGEAGESVALVEGDDCLAYTLGMRVGLCVRARLSLARVHVDDF